MVTIKELQIPLFDSSTGLLTAHIKHWLLAGDDCGSIDNGGRTCARLEPGYFYVISEYNTNKKRARLTKYPPYQQICNHNANDNDIRKYSIAFESCRYSWNMNSQRCTKPQRRLRGMGFDNSNKGDDPTNINGLPSLPNLD